MLLSHTAIDRAGGQTRQPAGCAQVGQHLLPLGASLRVLQQLRLVDQQKLGLRDFFLWVNDVAGEEKGPLTAGCMRANRAGRRKWGVGRHTREQPLGRGDARLVDRARQQGEEWVAKAEVAGQGQDQDRGLEEGLEPIKLWAKRLIDGVIQDEQGCDDLEFSWNDAPTIDPVAQAGIDDVSLRNGSATIDEVRARRGEPCQSKPVQLRPKIILDRDRVRTVEVDNNRSVRRV